MRTNLFSLSIVASLAAALLTACQTKPEETTVRIEIPTRTGSLQTMAETDAAPEWFRVSVRASDIAAPLEVSGATGSVIILQVPTGNARVFKAELFADANWQRKTYEGESAPTNLAGESATVAIDVFRVGEAPSVASAVIAEEEYFTNSVLTVTPTGWSGAADLTPAYKYAWFVNGKAVAAQTRSTLDGLHFARGDKVHAEVIPTDGTLDGASVKSNEVTILNSAPVLVSAGLGSGPYYIDSKLKSIPVVSDPDDDVVTYLYAWYVNGVTVGNATASTFSGGFYKGKEVVVRVTAYDGDAFSSTVAASVIIANKAPFITGSSLDAGPFYKNSAIMVDVTAADSDPGDNISIAYLWYVNGVSAPSQTTNTLEPGTATKNSVVKLRFTPHDGLASGAPQYSSYVTIQNSLPTLTGITISPGSATATTTLTADAGTTSDADLDAVTVEYQWYKNGVPIALQTGATLAPDYFSHFDEITVMATPLDGSEYGLPVSAAPVVIGNTLPSITGAYIPAITYYTTTPIEVFGVGFFDADGDPEGYVVEWTLGESPLAETSSTLTGALKGYPISALVYPFDGHGMGVPQNTESITVANTVPVVTVSLPTDFVSGSNVVPTVVITDPDVEDIVELTYVWYVNDVTMIGETAPAFSTQYYAVATGSTLKVEVTPSDGEAMGATVTDSATIDNYVPSAPNITLMPDPLLETAGELYVSFNQLSVDQDNQTVLNTYSWYQNGTLIGTSSDISAQGDNNLPPFELLAFVPGDRWKVVVYPIDESFATGVTAWVEHTVLRVSLQVAAGTQHSCVIGMEYNKLYCWGANASGQLGIGMAGGNELTPTEIPSFVTTTVDKVAAGGNSTCAIIGSGALYCWGDNSAGQVGAGLAGAQFDSPIAVSVLTDNVTQVEVGILHACAVRSGDAYCWGSNASGQVGQTSGGSFNTPQLVTFVTGPVVSISAGEDKTCAVDVDYNLICWGGSYPDSGQLVGTGYKAVSVGYTHACAVKTTVDVNGQDLECWGSNFYGELGTNNNTDYPTPQTVTANLYDEAIEVAAGRYHTCVVLSAGNIMCWGKNTSGSMALTATDPYLYPQYANINLGSGNANGIAIGEHHGCVTTDNLAMQCFGANESGQIGDGTSGTIFGMFSPQFGNLSDFDLGDGITCKISYGYPTCVGKNTSGQLGDYVSDGMIGWTFRPFGDGESDSASLIRTGLEHTCIKTQGQTVKCAGSNDQGQLGAASAVSASAAPLQVQGLGADIFALDTGDRFSCAVSDDTGVICWGANGNGQLGTGVIGGMVTSATPVTGLTDVTALSLGASHACALTTGGGVWCWGKNANGQVGDSSQSDRAIPAFIIAGGAVSVAAGDDFSCAALDSGLVQCWGANTWGQLGNANVSNQLTPVTIAGITNATMVAAGGQQACYIDTAFDLHCWGLNTSGQAGLDQATLFASTPTFVIADAEEVRLGKRHGCALVTADFPQGPRATQTEIGPQPHCWGDNLTGALYDDHTWWGVAPTGFFDGYIVNPP